MNKRNSPFKKDLRRPKTASARSFKIFINQFVDCFDWGMDKKHFYCSHRLDSPSISRKRLNNTPVIYRDKFKLKERFVKKHLESNDKKNFIYYVNDQRSYYPLFCMDIDTLDNTTDHDLSQVIDFLLQLHPNCYYEPSTNKDGVHFYILLDLTDYNYYTGMTKALMINAVMSAYVFLIRLWCNAHYNISVDSVKATFSQWKWVRDCPGSSVICDENNNVIREGGYNLHKCGTLCKLPCPQTDGQYFDLFNSPSFSLSQIVDNAKWLTRAISSLRGSFKTDYINNADISRYNNIDISSILKASYNKDPLTIKPFVERIVLPDSTLHCIPHSSILHNSMCMKNTQNHKNKTTMSGKSIDSDEMNIEWDELNEDKFIDITDAFIRSQLFAMEYFRWFYRQNNNLPTFEQFRNDYRDRVGTGVETIAGKNRLKQVYDYVCTGFNSKEISNGYSLGDFQNDINELISQEDVDAWVEKTRPNTKSRLRVSDLDVGMGYYWTVLTRRIDDKSKTGRELTAPNAGMIKWFQWLKKQGMYPRSCDKTKAVMIKQLLIHIGLIECVDDDYDYTGIGIAQRFIITPKCSRYAEFKQYYSQDIIDKWSGKSS